MFDALAPFDHYNGVLDVDIQVIPFTERRQPVGIDVRERNQLFFSTQLPRQDECRTCHGVADTHSSRKALRERRLSSTEVAFQHDDVARSKNLPERFTDGTGDVGRRAI